MPEVPRWRLIGDWFDVCRCRVPCGCTFAQAPDEGQCDGILAWHVRQGSYGDVALDGLNVVGVGSFEGNLWAGDTKAAMGFFFDERADERQREALQVIFGGRAGGWPAGFAELIGDMRGIEFAPIDFEIADDLAHWRVEVPGKARGSADALTGPTTPEGARVQVHNAPGGGGPRSGRNLGHGQGGRGRGIRLPVELAGPVQQAFSIRLVRTGRLRSRPAAWRKPPPGVDSASRVRRESVDRRSHPHPPAEGGVMAWKLEGTYFETCSCEVVCPCTVSLALGADYDRCNVTLVFHVVDGDVDGTNVSGLTVAVVADSPKVMSDGNWRLGLFIDAAASDEQADRLGAVFGGQLGGPMEALAPLVSENLGVERAPIDVREDGLRHSVRIGEAIDFEIEDVVPFGAESGEPARVSGVFHPAGSELTIAKATRSRISAFGIEYEGKAGFSASPFSWAA